MTNTKSSGSSAAVRAAQPEQFYQTSPRPVSAGDYLNPPFLDTAALEVMDRFSEKFLPAGTDAGPEEYHELRVLEQFLGRHVKPAGIRDVQCMLLWSEWVRTFCRRTPGFPKLIREKEFREVITGTFDTDIAHKGFRGNVYNGIKFVP
jgi:hypothetical protein